MAENNNNLVKYTVAGGGAALVAAAAITGAALLSSGTNEYASLTEEQINAVIDAKYGIDMSLYLPDMSMLDNVVALTTVEAAETQVPEVAEMEVRAARVTVPQVADMEVKKARVNVPEARSIRVARAEVAVPDADVPEVDLPEVPSDYTEEIAELISLLQELQSALRDHRSIQHDPNIYGGAKRLKQWMKIYSEYQSSAVATLAWSSVPNLRIIAEVRVPQTSDQRDTLAANLAFYKTRGYNGVLVVFDGSESPSELSALARSLKKAGLVVWFAFGGKEDLKVSVFPDPNKLKRQIQALAQYSDAWVAGWRRTSAHLLEQDKAYMNYFADHARTANANLAIIGEVYRGETASHPIAGQPGWGLNIPTGASAALLCNFGYSGVAVENVMRNIAPEQTKLPLVAVIGGERAYYLTTNPNQLGWERNQAIKEQLEKRFLAAGAVATITTHDDGHDAFKNRQSASLTELLITELE